MLSTVPNEVPTPLALESTIIQGSTPLLMVPVIPVVTPTKVGPVVVVVKVATPLPGALPRFEPRNRMEPPAVGAAVLVTVTLA